MNTRKKSNSQDSASTGRAARRKVHTDAGLHIVKRWNTEKWDVPGFDYALALAELNQIYTLDELTVLCGYRSRGSIHKTMNRVSTPSHPQGEQIYTIYVETFNKDPRVVTRKPPNKKR